MTDTFPCLSVRQPWADLIVSGQKDVENRTWKTNLRGRILIHASKNTDLAAFKAFLLQNRDKRLRGESYVVLSDDCLAVKGAIVGIVTIADCVEEHISKWFQGPYGWLLKDARKFDTPIPYRGQLRIFRVDRNQIPGGCDES